MTSIAPPKHRPHIAVIGGGFAGLECIKQLRGSGARITLIDQSNHHLFQPLLYQVATTVLPACEIAWPLRGIFKKRKDVTILMDRVVGVDVHDQEVFLQNTPPVAYDHLILATGARHAYFGHPEWEGHAPGLKSLADAGRIREKVLNAFEAAERSNNLADRQRHQTFVVVGAGPTGVELAGIIADLARRVLPGQFRNCRPEDTRLILVEAGDRVLSSFHPRLSAYAHRQLERLGVEIKLNQRVTACWADRVQLSRDRVEASTILWAAGVQASAAAAWVEAPQDSCGRALVDPDLGLPGNPDVSLVGDTVALVDAKGKTVPGNAPAAKQMGAYVAAKIKRALKGKPAPRPFVYRSAGNLATIGRQSAVADFGWIKLRGPLAWWIWGGAHIFFLIGTRSRLVVAISWLWSFFTGQNSARLIVNDAEKK